MYVINVQTFTYRTRVLLLEEAQEMLELQKSTWNRCTITVGKVRLSESRRALIVYLRELRLPWDSALYVARRALVRTARGIRLYRLPKEQYIFVDYKLGFVTIDRQPDLMTKLLNRGYGGFQIVLWVRMAQLAALGIRQSGMERAGFVRAAGGVEDLNFTNVAPRERRKRRRKRKVRKEVARKPSGYTWEEIQEASPWLGPPKIGSLVRKE